MRIPISFWSISASFLSKAVLLSKPGGHKKFYRYLSTIRLQSVYNLSTTNYYFSTMSPFCLSSLGMSADVRPIVGQIRAEQEETERDC